MPAVLWAGMLLVPVFSAIDVARFYAPTDFRCLFTAARMLARGDDPYDRVAWSREVGGPEPNSAGILRPSPCRGFDRFGAPLDRFPYPLWTALLLMPLGVLPAATAAALWIGLLIAGTFVGILLTWRSVGPPGTSALLFAAVVLTSEPFWLTLENAQLGGLLFGLAALTVRLGLKHRAVTGIPLALLALKPHITLLTLLSATAWSVRRARAMAVCAGAIGAVILVATVALRPGWIPAWLGQLPGEQGGSTTFNHGTIWQLAALWNVQWWVAGAIAVALTLELGWAARRAGGSLADIVGASLVAGLLLAPYEGSYDHLLLAPAWARILGVALASVGARRVGLLLAVLLSASLLPWVLYAIDETLTALVVMATALALVAALSGARAALPTYRGAPSPSPASRRPARTPTGSD